MVDRTKLNLEMDTEFYKKVEAFVAKHGLRDTTYAFGAAISMLIELDENPNNTVSFLMNGQLRIEQRLQPENTFMTYR